MNPITELYIQFKCAHCKQLTIMHRHELKTIQQCSHCGINSYITIPPASGQVERSSIKPPETK